MIKYNKPIAQLARPTSLEDLTLDLDIIKNIRRFTLDPDTMPHLIFSGPPGTGKTSAARVLSNEILKNMTHFNYKELNASVDRGVQVVRTDIMNFVNNRSFFKIDSPDAPYKIVFLDEADMLTNDAQNALRNMMETYASNCRFILSCNSYQKIVPALKSRTLHIIFKPLDYEKMVSRVSQINQKYELGYSEDKIKKSCQIANGDFRVAYNYLSTNVNESKQGEVKEFAQFIIHKSINVPIDEVYQVINLKINILEKSTKYFYKSLCEELISINNSNIFLIMDRLAQAQAATYTGATELVQFMGWYTYYRSKL